MLKSDLEPERQVRFGPDDVTRDGVNRYTDRALSCYGFAMSRESNRVNVLLAADHAAKLRLLAERVHVSPGTLARSLLSQALDEAEPSSASITALLGSIDGAFERAEAGSADVAAGRYVRLEDI